MMADAFDYDFPYGAPSTALEPSEDTSLELLMGGGQDIVDARAEDPDEDDSPHFDSCDTLPIHIRSTNSSTGGDVLKGESPFQPSSPFLPLKTGADVINLFRPKKHASGDVDEVFTDKVSFKYTKRKSSKAVQHFIFGDNFHNRPYGDFVDARGQGDVADSPTGSTMKPSPSRPQIHHCESIEEEYRYDMKHKQRGCFVIFNQETFDYYNKLHPDEKPLQDRAGSDRDAYNLESAAESLGFEHVRILHNLTKLEIVQWIYNLSKANHHDYDCFACAILTHGGNGDILYARDAKMKLTDFTRPFCADVCESLAGKPKLFFIQACRGVRLDRGKPLRPRTGPSDAVDGPTPIADGSSEGGPTKELTVIPTEADFLIANSTVPDYYAWRNESNGSWFVQSLCAIFKRYGLRMELMQMMTRVNRMVAYNFSSSSDDPSTDRKKQIPSIATRLTHEVFFVPKEAQKQKLPTIAQDSFTSPRPTTSSTMVCQTRMEAHYGNVEVLRKETFTATTTSTPQVNYPSGDYNTSPGLPQTETTFFPSPKNVTKVTKAPHVSPLKCPRSQFPVIPEDNTPLSSSTPKSFAGRLLSDNEAYSQSLGTSGIHSSTTVPAGMNEVASTLNHPRLSNHRCSLPVNRRNEQAAEDLARKGIKQTNV